MKFEEFDRLMKADPKTWTRKQRRYLNHGADALIRTLLAPKSEKA